jgi:LysR family transcriptional regulator, regulator for metE and metH
MSCVAVEVRENAMTLKPETRLEIRHLKLLAAVAEQGTITEASRRLHLTQSALSHQLRDAEEKLGAPLFLRLGKRMLLTAAGEKLLSSARKVLEELQTAELQISGLNRGTRGIIRLSTECYTCYHWLPAVLKNFTPVYPDVEVKIVLEATARPIAALLKGELDLAVISRTTRHRNLRLTPTCADELVVVMSPVHRLAGCPYVEPRDLAGETLFCYPPKEESTLFLRVLQPARVEAARVIAIPLTESIVDMVSAGLGVALLAQWAVKQYVSAGKIVTRPVQKSGFRRQWYAATLRSQPATPYMTEFVKLLSQACKLDSA